MSGGFGELFDGCHDGGDTAGSGERRNAHAGKRRRETDLNALRDAANIEAKIVQCEGVTFACWTPS